MHVHPGRQASVLPYRTLFPVPAAACVTTCFKVSDIRTILFIITFYIGNGDRYFVEVNSS